MLSLVTDNFEVLTADVDERAAEIKMEEDGVPALKVSEHLAEIKARAVYDSLSDEEKENSIVIGADTSVILDNIIFGKPTGREEAVNMLSMLSGHTHVVATGVAVFEGSNKKTFTEETRVEFNEPRYEVHDGVEEINDYIFLGSKTYVVLSIPRSVHLIGDNLFGIEGGHIEIRD